MESIEAKIEKKKLQDAYLYFLDERESFKSPSEFPLSYNFCELIKEKKWKSVPFIEIKISEELRETINLLNFWHYNLINWEIWLNVLEKYNEHDAWLILYNFTLYRTKIINLMNLILNFDLVGDSLAVAKGDFGDATRSV